MATRTNQVCPPPPFFQTPGDPPIPWTRWVRIFNNYILAGFPDDLDVAKKKAILINSLGTEGQRKFYNEKSDTDIDDYDYVALKTAIAAVFAPKVNVIALRVQFRCYTQKEDESVSDLLINLAEMISHCNYGTSENELLRDQFICSLKNSKIRERILTMDFDKQTLEHCKAVAINMERSKAELKLFNNPGDNVLALTRRPAGGQSNTNEPRDCYKQRHPTPSQGNNKCYRCGSARHLANSTECRARSVECRKCNKPGHFAKMCLSGTSKPGNNVHRGESSTVRNIGGNLAQLSFGDSSDSDVNAISKDTMHTTNQGNMRITVRQLDQTVKLLLDTGSQVSILNRAKLLKLFPKVAIEPTDQRLYTYNNADIDIQGKVNILTTLGDTTRSCSYYVTDCKSIFGLDLFNLFQLQVVPGSHTLQVSVTDAEDSMLEPPSATADDDVLPSLASGCPPSVRELVQVHSSLFQGVGRAKYFQHDSKMIEGISPTIQKARQIPIAYQHLVDKEIEKLLKHGTIESVQHPSKEDWVTPVVVTPKGENKVKLALDMRLPNKAIVQDRYPLPNIRTLMANIKSANFISKLDLKYAYSQLPLSETTKRLATFAVPRGLYRMKAGFYGLKDLPESFQRMMDVIFHGLEKFVFVYFDDILIVTETLTEHETVLSEVFRRLEHHGLKLSGKKCEFLLHLTTWLGYELSHKGFAISEDRISAVKDLRAPTSASELSSILSMLNYFRHFLPSDYSERTKSFRELLRNGVPWDWTASHNKVFCDLKEIIASAPVLHFYDPSLETILTCDASSSAVGAVLTQVQDSGREAPIAFLSHSLPERYTHYHINELELFACVKACESFDVFLRGRPFILRTDNTATLGVINSQADKNKSNRILRWRQRLLCYDFSLQYRPGKGNIADPFSRFVNSVSRSKDVLTLATIKEMTLADDNLLAVITALSDGNWKDKLIEPFRNVRHHLLYKKDLGLVVRDDGRIVIPTALRECVLTRIHGSHMGIVKCKQLARSCVYWPGIDDELEMQVKNCQICQESDKSAKHLVPKSAITPSACPEYPFQRIQIDIAGPITDAPAQFRYLIIAVDEYSKWVDVLNSSSATSDTCLELIKSMTSVHGAPEIIKSDNGVQFTSSEFREHLVANGISQLLRPLYSPKSTGGVERVVGTVKRLLKCNVQDDKSWKDALRDVATAIRSSKHIATGFSPFEILSGGRQMRLDIPLLPENLTHGRQRHEHQYPQNPCQL
jgi:hypothetical protein